MEFSGGEQLAASWNSEALMRIYPELDESAGLPAGEYLYRRMRIGRDWCRSELKISWLLGAYWRYVSVFLLGVLNSRRLRVRSLRSFLKFVFMEMMLTVGGYVEELRKRGEEYFRSIFEATSDAIFLFAPDGSVLDANPAALEMLGLPKEEVTGGRCYRVVHGMEERCDARECTIEKVLRGERVRGMLHRHRSADGRLIEVEVTASGVMDSDGKVIAIVEAARDVSFREKTMREFESRIAELERWRRVTVDRELRMAELKEENRRLRREVERLRRICAEVREDVGE
jgi:PAS domain S-box-containing protein